MGAGERERAPAEVVDRAAGRAHDHLTAAFERLEVAVDRLAAHEADGTETVEPSEVIDDVVDLVGEFTGGDEDQRLDVIAIGIDRGSKRIAEGERLACTGLRQPDHVAAFIEERHRLLLDRRRLFEAEFGHGAEAGPAYTDRAEGLRQPRLIVRVVVVARPAVSAISTPVAALAAILWGMRLVSMVVARRTVVRAVSVVGAILRSVEAVGAIVPGLGTLVSSARRRFLGRGAVLGSPAAGAPPAPGGCVPIGGAGLANGGRSATVVLFSGFRYGYRAGGLGLVVFMGFRSSEYSQR